ncbi:MAG: hypothetical protein KBC27_02175 [Rickettsiales bacterium]|nr:hypothetical protein [Rickettsiales bacterium]
MKNIKLTPHNLKTTKEMQYKFENDLTLSPLDLCLKKSIISKEMHRNANFFIYLYSVRYGNKKITSNYGYYIKTKISIQYTGIEEKQNKLYKTLSNILIQENTYTIVRDVCIFSKCPLFLQNPNFEIRIRQNYQITKEYSAFMKGMTTISKILSR